MSREERTGIRDLTFSRWHRTLPNICTCIDIDFLEYCMRCRKPLALIETAKGHHNGVKPTVVLRQLALQAGIPSYLVMFDLDEQAPYGIKPDIRVQVLTPTMLEIEITTLDEFGKIVTRIHEDHERAVHNR